MLKRAAALVVGLFSGFPLPALAQMQQGYESTVDAPQIQVDRSVLGDLKGYQPPPMFGTPETDAAAPPISNKIAPPDTPSLTAPRAEDILNHPVENNHVLTEHNPQSMTAPVAPLAVSPSDDPRNNPLLPFPDDPLPVPVQATAKSPAPSITLPPLPKHKPKNLAKATTPEPKKTPPKVEQTASKIIPAPPVVTPQPPKDAYRPKAAKTMPAVPPVLVEKSALPALPPPTDNMMEHRQPTIGERMMDASLARHIETDNDKIKETLKAAADKIPVVKPDTPALIEQPVTPPAPTPSAHATNSLVFAAGKTDVTADLGNQIKKDILPRLTKDTSSRIQILSFATSPDKSESTARRISLSRALSVRDYLLTQKIDAARIDVRALANQGGANSDRVDVVLLK